MTKHLSCLLLALLATFSVTATEYYVRTTGNDANDGQTPSSAFATIQRGVDALTPGDTLLIGPGEYRESVRRAGIGSIDVTTTIRAEIPGTVILRGDVPVGEFKLVPGSRMTYVTTANLPARPRVINELNTWKILQPMPNVTELDYVPGRFFYDEGTKQLYISTPDMRSAENRRYTASVADSHGMHLEHAKRLVIDGLTITGFNPAEEAPRQDSSQNSYWGIVLVYGHHCIIRNCRVYFNGNGICVSTLIDSTGYNNAPGSGDNIIEACEAWANFTTYGTGDRGGLTIFRPRRDIIRNSVSFLNQNQGLTIRGASTEIDELEGQSFLVDNLIWGNGTDVKIKTGNPDYLHRVERCVLTGSWSLKTKPVNSIVGKLHTGQSVLADNVLLHGEEPVDQDREFADPANHDFRLQGTSSFRNAAPNGGDRGPFPYRANIFYVKPDGNAAANGLSMEQAWQSLDRAVSQLKPGDTLYLAPGTYQSDGVWNLVGEADQPIAIRGRGTEPVVLQSPINLANSRHVELERLQITSGLMLADGTDILLRDCWLAGEPQALLARSVAELKVMHCAFTGFREAAIVLESSSGVDLRSNLYDNEAGVALRTDREDAIRYSDYHGYMRPQTAWSVQGTTLDLAAAPESFSRQFAARFTTRNGALTLINKEQTKGLGLYGRSVGPHRDEVPPIKPELMTPPVVHSLTPTTADIEWMLSQPVGCDIAWGTTPACENEKSLEINYFGTFSLTGLQPGTTYYFTLRRLRQAASFREQVGFQDMPPTLLEFDLKPISFTTPTEAAPPRTLHVASDGDDTQDGLSRETAWRRVAYAASQVRPGDTVLIAGGTYEETVRVRATGTAEAPITFQATPGEQVVMAGAHGQLGQSFVVAGKHHLRFDGFYFQGYSLINLTQASVPWLWMPGMSGEFHLRDSSDIEITRCFSDGRGGYSAPLIRAFGVDGLLIRNCVLVNKFDGTANFARSPNVRLEHNVFARPMIGSFILNNTADQPMVLRNNIFCGMLHKKAAYNVPFAEVEAIESLTMQDNCFQIRAIPEDERILFSDVDHALRKVTASYTRDALNQTFGKTGTLIANPHFVGDPGDKTTFSMERMVRADTPIDFDFFYTAHPDLMEKGIGLQPEAFADFHFNVNPGDRARPADVAQLTASHYEQWLPRLADGNAETLWVSKAYQEPGMWLQIDFPLPREIEFVSLTGGDPEKETGFDLYVDDGSGWSEKPVMTVASFTDLEHMKLPAGTIAQSLKWVLTKPDTENWLAFRELTINGRSPVIYQ